MAHRDSSSKFNDIENEHACATVISKHFMRKRGVVTPRIFLKYFTRVERKRRQRMKNVKKNNEWIVHKEMSYLYKFAVAVCPAADKGL